MPKISYPPKPWTDGQSAELTPGLKFMYSISLRKWVPVSPGVYKEKQLEQAFGVRTVEEVEQLFAEVVTLKQRIVEVGRIWKSTERPSTYEIQPNDIWVNTANGAMFYWDAGLETWIQSTSIN